jgi:hypothetical protein
MGRAFIALLFTLLAIAAPAAAQGPWEIELHGGWMQSNHPEDGTAALPAAGTAFTTATGLPSRRESSWYFGDGALLVNQMYAARGVSARITALDPLLTSAAAQRQNGASVGVRVGRHITSRYTAEFSVDYSRAELTMSDSAQAGIEASRASFLSAFSVPLPAGQVGLAPVLTATSTATVDQQRGRQVFTTGALNINLKTAGKIIPYVTVGGGVVINSGDTPSATLAGNYRIAGPPGSQLAGVVVHNETDTVNVRYSIEPHAFVGVVGGGLTYAVSSHWGVRLDIRAHISRNSISNLVDANPSVATLTPPTVLVIPANPAVQFSSNPSTGAQSSLGGPPLNGFQTFGGSGTHVQINIVPGFFWRF